MLICAIDPGNVQSALVVWNGKKLFQTLILPNDKFLLWLKLNTKFLNFVVIEMIANQGNVVGQSVFDTCRMVGKIEYLCITQNIRYKLIYRHEVKLHHLGTVNGNDSAILKTLTVKYGHKGTKKNPGVLYGVSSHCWQALAIATMITEKPGLLVYIASLQATPI